MRTTVNAIRMLIRLLGLVLIVLGVLFWTGNALTLIPIHMLVGIILVLALWVLAILAARAGVGPWPVVLAIVWGLIVPILGVTQTQLLPGSAHWVIQVLHLVVGLGAIGQAEALVGRMGYSRRIGARVA